MWEIITFSDVSVLSSVLNAIAVIFADDTYRSASVVVSLAVIMGMAVASLGGQKEMPFAKWSSACLMFGFGFFTTTSVSIENRNTGDLILIDNLPFAIAAPASVITQVGYSLTEIAETAFGNTDGQRITVNGYLSPLTMMANYRKLLMTDVCLAGDKQSTINGIRLCPTLTNYARDCAAVKFAREGTAFIDNQQGALEAMKFESSAHTTKIIKQTPPHSNVTCKQAFQTIEAILIGAGLEQMLNANAVELGKKDAMLSVSQELKQNLEAIAKDAVDERKLTQAIYTYNHMVEGTQAFLHKIGADALAENYTSSVNQGNLAWAMQGELFISIIDHFLKIMEAVLYAIAPFIGLMLLTGSLGIKTFTMYVQVLVVFQFIPMMLVLVQNILLDQAAEIFHSLIGKGYDASSYTFMLTLAREMEQLAALGGLLAATVVPALAMALVSGSTFAVTGALKELGAEAKDTDFAADHVDQGKHIRSIKGLSQTEYKDGISYTENAKARIAEVNFEQVFASSVEKNKSLAKETERGYQQKLEHNAIGQYIKSRNQAQSRTIGEQILQGSSAQDKTIQNTINSLDTHHQLTKETKAELAANIYAEASKGVNFIIAKGQVGAKLAASLSGAQSEVVNEILNSKEAKELSQEFSENYEKARKQDLENQQSISIKDDFIQNQNKGIQKAYNEKTKAAKALLRVSSLAEKIGVSSSKDKILVNNNIAKNPQMMERINQYYANLDSENAKQIKEDIAYFTTGLNSFSDEQALSAAVFRHLGENNLSSDAAHILTGDDLYLATEEGAFKPSSIFTKEDKTKLEDIDTEKTMAQITAEVNAKEIDSILLTPVDNTGVKVDKKGKLQPEYNAEFKQTAKEIAAQETDKRAKHKQKIEKFTKVGKQKVEDKDQEVSAADLAKMQLTRLVPEDVLNFEHQHEMTYYEYTEHYEELGTNPIISFSYSANKTTEETSSAEKTKAGSEIAVETSTEESKFGANKTFYDRIKASSKVLASPAYQFNYKNK